MNFSKTDSKRDHGAERKAGESNILSDDPRYRDRRPTFRILVSGKENLFPDNDALMTVISCCAQIIAGLYGIMLAGYTFFMSRIDALMATDATLDYIVGSVKMRFKSLICYITAV